LRIIADDINSTSVQFAVVVDGTQDLNGNEQEVMCIRHADKLLQVHETFMGLVIPPNITGQSVATSVMDTLLQLTLPADNLRAQTHDGAAVA